MEFGRLQARQLRALVPGGGVALLVHGDPFDSASRGRTQGFGDVMSGSGIVVADLEGRWEREVAESVVHRWLTSPLRQKAPLHAVVCQNDDMGLGARRALVRAAAELGRPELSALPVLGGDGLDDQGQIWVDKRELTSTVKVTLPGSVAVDQLAQFWKQGAPLPPVTRLAPTSYP